METETREGVLRCRADARWLSSGWRGGFSEAAAAYNVSVPEGWPEVDLDAYAAERRARADFDAPGPTLFTGVDVRHARGARAGPVTAVATAGVSNPAALPMDPDGEGRSSPPGGDTADAPPGTVNVVLYADRTLTDGALASLSGVVVEAKAATLLDAAGVPGTTTDAVIVGCPLEPGEAAGKGGEDDDGPAAFAGSATRVGGAARACVREAVRASLDSRYADESPPSSVADAEYGVATRERATVFTP